jgi:hypothetical protein
VFQKQTVKRADVRRQYHSETKLADPEQIGALVVSLSGRVRLLDSDIEAEEERTQCSDRRDPAYSLLARALIARRDNLCATIAVLQERLVPAEGPEWNNS